MRKRPSAATQISSAKAPRRAIAKTRSPIFGHVTVADLFDYAGELRTEHEWQRILGLVAASDLQCFDEADARSLHTDSRLTFLNRRTQHLPNA